MDGVEIYGVNGGNMSMPMLDVKIPAGFPSPAQDCNSDSLDLNRELIHNPASTYCARVIGDSMIDVGIDEGDLLVIDKSIPPTDGSVAVCFLDGEFTVKRLAIRRDGVYLVPENAKYQPIRVHEDSNFQVWGIVTYIIKRIKK